MYAVDARATASTAEYLQGVSDICAQREWDNAETGAQQIPLMEFEKQTRDEHEGMQLLGAE